MGRFFLALIVEIENLVWILKGERRIRHLFEAMVKAVRW